MPRARAQARARFPTGVQIKTSEILSGKGIDLHYGSSQAVRGASIALRRGEVTAITGQSGSGKSSLLYCLAGVLPVANGEVRFEGRLLGELDDEELSALRRDRFGFVFQYGELLPELTVEENTALPLRLAGQRKAPALAAAGEVLGRLGLADLRDRRPSQVSGGRASALLSLGLSCTGPQWSSPTSRLARSTVKTRPLCSRSSSSWPVRRARLSYSSRTIRQSRLKRTTATRCPTAFSPRESRVRHEGTPPGAEAAVRKRTR